MPLNVQGTVQLDATLGAGLVELHPDPLRVNVKSCKYDIGGLRGTFDGAVAQTVADDDVSYAYLSTTGSLVINTTGYPTDETYIPIARIVAAGGEITAIHDERVLLATSAAVQGTCVIGFPVDAGVKGGNATVSSNNSVPSLAFDDIGESRNRWNARPPQNYISGDLVLRLICSFAATPANNDSVRWQLDWQFVDSGDVLPSSYAHSVAITQDVDHLANDEVFTVDFTIPEAQFDKAKDFMAFYLRRDADHVGDDCSYMVHIHLCELRYTGYKVAGQAGQ